MVEFFEVHKPIYATDLRELITVKHHIHYQKRNPSYMYSSKLADIVLSPVERFGMMVDQVESFMFVIPAARAPPPVCWCSNGGSPLIRQKNYKDQYSASFFPFLTPFWPAIVRRQVYFPDRRLIQFDCGKLQELAVLLRQLKTEGHRALIFTQMTKMLDVLEAFINLYGYTYMRLDGSTPPEERQTLMQRFNTNPKIFLFILSTRSGGVGINLVGADTVIFYDSDWNPAMDQQAQDRCHRIGQTREVHIYRLISESTIEENILKKANQKRALDNLVIQSGSYNTDFFKKLDPLELFSGHQTIPIENVHVDKLVDNTGDAALSSADLEAALRNAEDEADYMALKKVEEEEAVDNQEFTEEAIGKFEDDELGNEEDLKVEDTAEHGELNTKSDEDNALIRNHPIEKEVPTLTSEEDDVDMLGDVKQIAAAASMGQVILSFENQLRPIDRYAIQFLELWDPIIEKTVVESDIQIEEREWELERIEKLKNDMEAEIDEDEEPLVYERWDADFATEVYRQQVEALAQHQLMEDLEREAQIKEALECGNSDSLRDEIPVAVKPKPKKKTKKSKFKSLKKGALVSKSPFIKAESSIEVMSMDDEFSNDEMIISSGTLSPCSTREKKRKPVFDDGELERNSKSKRVKVPEPRNSHLYSKSSGKYRNEHLDLKISDNGAFHLESKQLTRAKTRGKLSISVMPLKRVFTLRQEKFKKKGNIWSKDSVPSPDLWSSNEYAVLCSVVNEYGPNWNLASEILYGATAGGFYRGRFRHPVHCCERFRELIQRYVMSVSDATNSEKAVNIGSWKALLRVNEDNIRSLLSITSELSDHEPLLPKHFFSVLSAAWKHSSHPSIRDSLLSSQNEFYSPPSLCDSTFNHLNSLKKTSEIVEFGNLYHCGVLVAAALNGDCSHQTDDGFSILNQKKGLSLEKEKLDITLELQGEKDEITPLPSVFDLTLLGPDPSPSLNMHTCEDCNFKSSQHLIESRFRTAWGTCEDINYLEKHKLIYPDSAKPSKSKLKRTSVVNTDSHSLTASQVSQPLPKTFTDSSIIFGGLSSSFPDGDVDIGYLHDVDDEVASLGTPGTIPYLFGPDLTSEVDDWSILPEFTDVG